MLLLTMVTAKIPLRQHTTSSPGHAKVLPDVVVQSADSGMRIGGWRIGGCDRANRRITSTWPACRPSLVSMSSTYVHVPRARAPYSSPTRIVHVPRPTSREFNSQSVHKEKMTTSCSSSRYPGNWYVGVKLSFQLNLIVSCQTPLEFSGQLLKFL